MLRVYNEQTPTVKLGGPTNFAPIIEEACGIVQKTKRVTFNIISMPIIPSHIVTICLKSVITYLSGQV